MVEIDEKKARNLLFTGQAGYWSLHAKAIVVEHDVQTVIRLNKKWFLAPISEFKIKFCGKGVFVGQMKNAFSITIENSEIEEMVKSLLEFK